MSGRAKKGRVAAGSVVMSLDPATIMVPKRIGFFFEDKAVALGRMMAVDGQRDPIKVTRLQPSKSVEECIAEGHQPWMLVVGMHRLKGCILEGIEVLAIEVGGKTEDLEEFEASENMHRRDVGPLERAKFTGTLAAVARARFAREHGEELSQQQLAIRARWARVNTREDKLDPAIAEEAEDTRRKMRHVYGWRETVSDALGVSFDTIDRDILLFRQIIEPFPDLVEPLAMHPIVGTNAKALREIARVAKPETRRKVIEALIGDQAVTLDAAMAAAGLDGLRPQVTPVEHEKFSDAVVHNFKRLTLPQQRDFLPKFVALLTPEMKRGLRDQLIEELGSD